MESNSRTYQSYKKSCRLMVEHHMGIPVIREAQNNIDSAAEREMITESERLELYEILNAGLHTARAEV